MTFLTIYNLSLFIEFRKKNILFCLYPEFPSAFNLRFLCGYWEFSHKTYIFLFLIKLSIQWYVNLLDLVRFLKLF